MNQPNNTYQLTSISRATIWWLLTIALVTCTWFMADCNNTLTTPNAPLGMVSYELVQQPDSAKQIIQEWQSEPHVRNIALFSLGVDFLYMWVYACWLTLSIYCVGLAKPAKPNSRNKTVMLLCIMFGMISMDFVETVTLSWQFLNSTATSLSCSLVFYSAVIKFSFISIASLWLLVALGRWLTHKFTNK